VSNAHDYKHSNRVTLLIWQATVICPQM